MWLMHKNNIARGLLGGDNNIFVMEERQVLSNIWVFKDLEVNTQWHNVQLLRLIENIQVNNSQMHLSLR